MTRDELKAFLAPLPDEAVLALTLYGEARGEPIEGIIAVGCVIRNRIKDLKNRWPKTYRGVSLQAWQFSVWNVKGADANHHQVLTMAQKMIDKQPTPNLEEIAWVALGITRDALRDNTKKSNHYHAISLLPRPAWAQSHVPTVQVRNHVFYAL